MSFGYSEFSPYCNHSVTTDSTYVMFVTTDNSTIDVNESTYVLGSYSYKYFPENQDVQIRIDPRITNLSIRANASRNIVICVSNTDIINNVSYREVPSNNDINVYLTTSRTDINVTLNKYSGGSGKFSFIQRASSYYISNLTIENFIGPLLLQGYNNWNFGSDNVEIRDNDSEITFRKLYSQKFNCTGKSDKIYIYDSSINALKCEENSFGIDNSTLTDLNLVSWGYTEISNTIIGHGYVTGAYEPYTIDLSCEVRVKEDNTLESSNDLVYLSNITLDGNLNLSGVILDGVTFRSRAKITAIGSKLSGSFLAPQNQDLGSFCNGDCIDLDRSVVNNATFSKLTSTYNFSTGYLSSFIYMRSNSCILNSNFSLADNAVKIDPSAPSKTVRILGNQFTNNKNDIQLGCNSSVIVNTNKFSDDINVFNLPFLYQNCKSTLNLRLTVDTNTYKSVGDGCDLSSNSEYDQTHLKINFFGSGEFLCMGGNMYMNKIKADIPPLPQDNVSEDSSGFFSYDGVNDNAPLAYRSSYSNQNLDLNFGDISTFRLSVDTFRAFVAGSSSASDINILFGKLVYTRPPGGIIGTYNFTHFDGFKDYIYSSNKNASLTDLNFKDFNFIYNYGQYNPVTVRIKSGATSYDYTFDINVKTPILKIRYNKTNGTHMDYNFPSQNGTGIIMASADENLQILSIENVYDQLYIQAGFYKSSSSSSTSQEIYNLVGQIFTNNTINIDSNFGTCFSKDNIYTTTNNLDIINCLDPGVRLPWIFRATVISKLLNYNLKNPLDTINVNSSPSIACMIKNNTNSDINYTLDLTNMSASDINITDYFIQDPIAFNNSYNVVSGIIYHPNIGTPRLNGYLSKYSLSFIRPIYVDDSNYSTIAYGNTANTYQISYKSSINVSTITNDFYYKKMFAFPVPPRIKVTLNGQTYDSGVFVDKKYICLPNSQDYSIAPSVPSAPVEIKFTDQVSSIPIDINVDYIDFSKRTNYADFNKYFLDVKIQNADYSYSRTLVFSNSTYSKMFGTGIYNESLPACQNVDRNAGIFTKDSKGNNFRINFDQNGFVVDGQFGCQIRNEKIPYGDYNLIVNYGVINKLNTSDYKLNNFLYWKQFTIPITIKTAQNTIDFSNDINTNKACYDQVMNYDFNIFSSYNQSSADVNVVFSQDDGQVLYYEQRTVTLNTGQNMISGSFNPKDKGFTSDGVKNAKVVVKINGKEYTKDYTFTLTCIKTVATPDISFMFAVILITIVCFTFVYNNRR